MKHQNVRRARTAPFENPPPTPKRFLRRRQVCAKVGLGATRLWELERAGDFPARIVLTPRCVVWDEGQIEAWMAKRAAAPIAPIVPPGRGRSR